MHLQRWNVIVGLLTVTSIGESSARAQEAITLTQPTPIEMMTTTESTPPPSPPAPFEGGLFERSQLTGDWFGARTRLFENGVQFRGNWTQFLGEVGSGGTNNNGTYGAKLNYFLNIDGEKAGLWKGFFIDMHAETIYGNSTNFRTGSLLPTNTAMLFPDNQPNTALTGLKFTQALSENFAVFFGKINTLDEDRLQYAGGGAGITSFMNTGLAFNAVPLRAIPYTTLGAGFAILKDLEPVFTFSVLDAQYATTTSGLNNLFSFGKIFAAEATLPTNFFDKPGHIKAGGVYSTRNYSSLDLTSYAIIPPADGGLQIVPARKNGTWSVYGSIDQAIWVSPCDPKRSWGFFAQGGASDPVTSPINTFWKFGIGGASPFREGDTFGIGYYYVDLSGPLQDSFRRGRVQLGDEQGFEAYYDFAVTPWFHLAPDLQIINPTRERISDATVYGLRARLDF
jgi:porin